LRTNPHIDMRVTSMSSMHWWSQWARLIADGRPTVNIALFAMI
jgi:hypothetical protein